MNDQLAELTARIANLEQAQSMILPIVAAEVSKAVKQTVNGRIEEMHKEMTASFDANMQEIRPLLQAAAGGKILYRVFTTAGSIAVGWIALKQTFGL